TPELRGVSIKVDSQSVSGHFVFDVEPTEELREIVDDAETEVLADYGGLTPVAFTSEYLPREQRLTLGPDEHWVFRRREPPTAL
ncbi:hypothetical protein, partial [Salinibacterium sp.]|uniref:hypothetical protein n=1 Tax=Salinibacterium sp. TaxID=1915057 RepID=UPI00286CC702